VTERERERETVSERERDSETERQTNRVKNSPSVPEFTSPEERV